jgi:hypothetical protein
MDEGAHEKAENDAGDEVGEEVEGGFDCGGGLDFLETAAKSQQDLMWEGCSSFLWAY